MLNIAERFSHIAERLELPPEAAGSPQVLVSGRRLVTVEGHRGIRLYGPERIEVRTRSGCAAVRGRDLQVCFDAVLYGFLPCAPAAVNAAVAKEAKTDDEILPNTLKIKQTSDNNNFPG